jgi:hypothetical protein
MVTQIVNVSTLPSSWDPLRIAGHVASCGSVGGMRMEDVKCGTFTDHFIAPNSGCWGIHRFANEM